MLRNQMTALTTVVVIAVVVRTASSIEGNATFGILKADGTLFPLIDELFVVEDLPIKMWCSSPEWTGCRWSWKKLIDPPIDCYYYDGSGTHCPHGALSKEDNRCVVDITKVTKADHEGQWLCELGIFSKNVSYHAEQTMSILKFVEKVTPNLNSHSIEVNKEYTFECSTGRGLPKAYFEWYLDGQIHATSPNETSLCEASGCITISRYVYVAPAKPLQQTLECRSVQNDTFGNKVKGQGFVSIDVVEQGQLVKVLTAGEIAGLVIGLVLFVLILLLVLLCFCCGWCCFAGRKKRRERNDQLTLVVQDNPRYPPPHKEVSFSEHHSYPDTLYATKYEAESSEGSSDDRNYFQQQITPANPSHWIGQQEVDSSSGFHHPPPPPSYFMADKWDPYDSEPDIPTEFRFEGNGYLMTPAGSLSSLASTHLDNIDLNYHLRHLDWVNTNSHLNESFDSDDETSSSSSSHDSEILGTLNSQSTLAQEKSMEDESWV